MMDLCVWWVSDAKRDAITQITGVPEYIREQYENSSGRCGRGRLWIAKELPIVECTWDDNDPVCRIIVELSCAGIIFKKEDFPAVKAQKVGFITDLQCNLIK